MNNLEIAKLIQEHFRYTDTPTETEVEDILDAVKAALLKKEITDKDLFTIINNIVSKKRIYMADSVDMSLAISILQQIIDAANKK